MKSSSLLPLILFVASPAFAGSFGSTCLEINPMTAQYVERAGDSNSLLKCVLDGFGAHYNISDIENLNRACQSEGDGRYLTLAADLTNFNGQNKAKMFVFCWPSR